MTYIKVNVTKINDCIEQYSKYKTDCFDYDRTGSDCDQFTCMG